MVIPQVFMGFLVLIMASLAFMVGEAQCACLLWIAVAIFWSGERVPR